MNQPVKSLPGRPRSAEADQAILQATLDLLAEAGYQSMSIEAIAARAGVGKTTIYRRYTSKEELVADALGSLKQELPIPDTGTLWGDIEILTEHATKTILTPLGRQTLALIISTASSNPQFAKVYWKKYMQPRSAFFAVLKRAQERGEIKENVDIELIYDLMSGSFWHSFIFKPESEPVADHVRRVLSLLLEGIGACSNPK
jgi:AcrR family transcriptional regulator